MARVVQYNLSPLPRTGRDRARVFSGKQPAGPLMPRSTAALTARDVQRIAQQVQQRCHSVTPLYAQEHEAR